MSEGRACRTPLSDAIPFIEGFSVTEMKLLMRYPNSGQPAAAIEVFARSLPVKFLKRRLLLAPERLNHGEEFTRFVFGRAS